MISLTLNRGLASHPLDPKENLLIVVGSDVVQANELDVLASRLSGKVDKDLLYEAMGGATPGTVLPLHLNRVQIISIPRTYSRGNSPANNIAFAKLLKQALAAAAKDSTRLSIALFTRTEHAVPLVATVARAFPLFSRKTSVSSSLAEVHLECHFVDDSSLSHDDWHGLDALIDAVRATAQLVDAPPNEFNVDALVEEAVAVAQRLHLPDPLVIRGDDLRARGFGGIYNVGKAALQPPAFVCISHKPEGATKSFALVGKGIMFDTGGLSIKTKEGMPGWKCDMAGAAAALHSFAALVDSNFTENLHVLLCIAENAVSPVANKPDDIITLLSGKTVEINNTDAEGRLVLADGVFYAKSVLKADTIIDIATLTVAQCHATGRHHAAILSNSEEWEKKARAAGLASGDLCHPMQFVPDLHMSDYTSAVADMKNSQLGSMMAAPSELAGLFIATQIDFGEGTTIKDGTNWLHIDMGTLAMVEDRATAYGVPLLTSLLGEYTAAPMILSGKKASWFKTNERQ